MKKRCMFEIMYTPGQDSLYIRFVNKKCKIKKIKENQYTWYFIKGTEELFSVSVNPISFNFDLNLFLTKIFNSTNLDEMACDKLMQLIITEVIASSNSTGYEQRVMH